MRGDPEFGGGGEGAPAGPRRRGGGAAAPGWRFPRILRRDSWPLLIFLGLSWTSTTFGLTRLIAAERGAPTMLELAIIGAFVFAATASMKLMLDLVLIERKIYKRVLSLIGYLLLMGFSIFFGFAFYWELLEARSQTFAGARGALASANRELSESRATLDIVAANIQGLKELSARMAERERTEGRTCEAGVGAGDGPRRRFRDAEAQRFGADAANVASRLALIDGELTRVDGQVTALEGLATQTGSDGGQALVAGFNDINGALVALEVNYNAMLAGSGLTALAGQYRQDAARYADPNFQRTGPNAAGRSSRFICHDPALARQLGQIAAAIERVQPLSFKPVEVLKDARATDEAFDRLSRSLIALVSFDAGPVGASSPDADAEARARAAANSGAAAGAPAPAARGGLIEQDYLPLFAASIVDVMILIFTLIEGPQRRWRMGEIDRGIKLASAAEIMMSELVGLSRKIADDPNFALLDDYYFTHGDGHFIAVPAAAPDPGSEALRAALRPISAPGGPEAADPWAAADAESWFLEQLEALHQDDKVVANLVRSLAAKGLARRVHPFLVQGEKRVSERFALRRSRAAGRRAYEIYKIDIEAWAEMVDSAFAGARDAADAAAEGAETPASARARAD